LASALPGKIEDFTLTKHCASMAYPDGVAIEAAAAVRTQSTRRPATRPRLVRRMSKTITVGRNCKWLGRFLFIRSNLAGINWKIGCLSAVLTTLEI
jgi:hypothetical protein